MLYLNDEPIKPTIFPDGTSQVWHIPEHLFKNPSTIRWEFEREGELMQLAQLQLLLLSKKISTTLFLKYLPYGRQDKEISNDSTFALRPFCSILNTFEFEKIICADPHSLVADEILVNFEAIYPTIAVENAASLVKADLFCYPDAGAEDKYARMYSSHPYIHGEKIRDPATGRILSYTLLSNFDKGLHPAGRNVLIVDDICDGGATFILLAKALYTAGAKSVSLFVTHGIFSKGLKALKVGARIQRIFTQDGEALREAGELYIDLLPDEKIVKHIIYRSIA